jgi:uncharacterized membrane protein
MLILVVNLTAFVVVEFLLQLAPAVVIFFSLHLQALKFVVSAY